MRLVRLLLTGILWSLCAVNFAACQTPSPAPAPATPPLREQDPSLREQGPSLREQAFGAENQGRFADAAEAYLKLVKQEPGRAEWVVAAGRCLGRSGRFRDAIDLLDQARNTFPGVIEVPAMLARTYLLKSEMDQGALNPQQLWSDAAELAEGVLAIEPNHEDSRLVLAQARYLLGDWAEAVKQAEEAAKRAPDRAGAHILLGRIALDRYRDLLATHAAGNLEPQAEADLVASLDAQRKLATKSFARAAQLDPSRAHPHVMLAQVAMLEHHDEEARVHLLDALAVDPDAAIDHSLFDRALDWQTRAKTYAEVLARYRATAAAKPQKAATLRWYEGRALYEGQQWEAARTAFEEALTGNPQATNSHYYAAMCAFQLGDHDAAENHAAAYATTGANAFAEVVRNLTGDTRGQVAAILKFLADRAFQKSRIDHSRDLNHVLAYLLDSADAWNNRALLCRDTGKFPEALDAYERALKKEPDSPQLLNDCAVILQYHLKSGENLAKARTMYERAIQLAEKLLADQTIPADLRERTQQALADARANLAELGK